MPCSKFLCTTYSLQDAVGRAKRVAHLGLSVPEYSANQVVHLYFVFRWSADMDLIAGYGNVRYSDVLKQMPTDPKEL